MRTKDESASELGQWVHDTLPHTFHFMDVDGIVFKRSTRVLRIIEHKHPGQTPKPSQQAILPLLSHAVDWLIAEGTVDPQSGVFVVHTDEPFDGAWVTPFSERHTIQRLTGEQWKRFMSGERV